MLKQTVTYKDFDDKPQTETLYFNLTRTDLIDLMDLIPRLEEWQQKVAGDPRELTVSEIRDMLDIIKILIEHSYGVREGNKHIKSPEVFLDFKSTMAYDAFLFGLFENIDQAVKFMTSIMPAEMMEQAAAADLAKKTDTVTLPDESSEINTALEEVPAWEREGRAPTRKELAEMSPEQLQRAFRAKIAKDEK